MPRMPPHLVLDDFLPAELHDALLGKALEQGDTITRGTVEHGSVDVAIRRAWTSRDLGDLKPALQSAIEQTLPALFSALSIPRFEPVKIELELSAHRDGDFYHPHIDTFYAEPREGMASDRVITAVYYFYAEPKGFSGGEFAIYPFGGAGDPLLIEPRDNRLLAIPAFALHEVRPIRCESDDFRSARFAVNAWVHRARESAPQ